MNRLPPPREAALVALAALLLTAVLYPGAATLTETFFFHDLAHHHYPWRVWAAREWMAGRIPLWNDLGACGFPQLADGQTGVLYPPNFLFLVLPGPQALSVSVLFHTGLAGFLMYLYARSAGLGAAGASLSAATFGLSGFFVTHLLYLPMHNAYPWLPGMLLCVDLVLRDGRRPLALGLALGVALVLLAFHPQIATYSLFFLLTYTVFRLARGYPELGLPESAGPRRLRGRRSAWIVLGVGLGLVLAAPQLQATAVLTAFSARAGGVDPGFAAMGSLPPQELVHAVLPRLFGYERPADVPVVYHHHGDGYWGNGENYWEDAFFLGVPGVLAALSAAARRRRGLGFFAGWAVLATLVMLGPLTPAWHLMRLVPGMGFFRFPVRFAYLLTFSIAFLAGAGLDRVREDLREAGPARSLARKARIGAALLGALWVLAAGAHFVLGRASPELVDRGRDYFTRKAARQGALLTEVASRTPAWDLPVPAPAPAEGPPAEVSTRYRGSDYYGWKTARIVSDLGESTDPLGPRVLLPLGMALGTLAAFLWRARAAPWLVVGLQIADLVAFGWGYNPTTPAEEVTAPPGTLGVLGAPPGPAPPRLSGFERHVPTELQGEAMSASLNLLWGWPDVVVPSPLRMVRFETLTSLAGQAITVYPTEQLRALMQRHRRLVDLLGVRHVLTRETLGDGFDLVRDGPIRVYANPTALPRAFLVGEAVVAPGDGPDGWAALLVAPGFDPVRTAVVDVPLRKPLGGSPVHGRADFEAYGPQSAVVRVQADRAALLVVTDTAYPGWTARLDGRDVPILTADGAFRGVEIPEGEHRVEFVYEDPVFLALFWGGCVAWFLWFLGFAAAAWRHATRPPDAPARAIAVPTGPGA